MVDDFGSTSSNMRECNILRWSQMGLNWLFNSRECGGTQGVGSHTVTTRDYG